MVFEHLVYRQEVYETLVNLASEICEGKLVSILEGGYSLDFVGKIATTTVAKMSGAFHTVADKIPTIKNRVKEHGEKAIKEVKKVQKDFWNL